MNLHIIENIPRDTDVRLYSRSQNAYVKGRWYDGVENDHPWYAEDGGEVGPAPCQPPITTTEMRRLMASTGKTKEDVFAHVFG